MGSSTQASFIPELDASINQTKLGDSDIDAAELHRIQIDLVSHRLTGKTTLCLDEVLAGRMFFERFCGIYFLIAQQEIIYIGQSTNVFYRIQQHLEHKKFDSFAFLPCANDKRELDRLESIYIHRFRPRLNGWRGRNCAPISLHALRADAGITV